MLRTTLSLLSVIAVIVLSVFNPSMTEFKTFIKNPPEQIIRRQAGGSALGRALSGADSGIVNSYVDRVADRKNYVLFSIYTVDLDGVQREAEEWRFLGIANHFIELERPTSVQRTSLKTNASRVRILRRTLSSWCGLLVEHAPTRRLSPTHP